MAIAKTYTQVGYQSPEQVFLDDETYKKVLPVWVKACIDAVLYFLHEDGTYKMVIGKRKIQPQKDWWIFGGRVFVSDLSLQAALARKLNEEIGLNILPARIPEEILCLNVYRWSDDNSVVMAPAFALKISFEEYKEMHRNLSASKEYSELAALPLRMVADNSCYHSALRDCAERLHGQLTLQKYCR